jgi:hypothetical protein
MSYSSDLMIEGDYWNSIKYALETGLGVYSYIIMLIAIIIAVYIKSESLVITGFVGLVGLLGFSLLYNIFTQPLIFVVVVVFIALVVFDVFIKGGGQR